MFEAEEELEESTETPRPKHEHGTPTTPHTSSEVRSRNSSPRRVVNTSNTKAVNSRQGSSTTQKIFPSVSGANIMVGTDIKLSIFNGNGSEDPEQHWFLYEAVWIVRHIHDENINGAQMVMNL